MITIFAWFGDELPKKTDFALIKQAGFDGVTLWWSDDFGDENFRDNPAFARKAGLYVENIHAPFKRIGVNSLWLDKLDGDALSDYFMRVVDECAENEIPAMVMHLSNGAEPPPFNEIGLDRLKRITERAEKQNINIALENLRKLEYLEYVLSNISSPRVGFCYDSGHHNCHTPNAERRFIAAVRLPPGGPAFAR